MHKTEKGAWHRTGLLRFPLIVLAVSLLFLGAGLVRRATLQGGRGKNFSNYSKSDAVTAAVRDRSKALYRLSVRNEVERSAASRLGTLVEDYGSFVVVAAEPGQDFSASGLESQRLETSINLPGKSFEPLADAPPETVRPGGSTIGRSSDKGYYIVQFAAPVRDEWLESLRSIGVEVLQYVPQQSFFVYADSSTMQRVANHARVRWVG
ncbi:MAG: hypothetical protein JO360_12350, partial [Acidobacteria bacterium]|nr:hypothetical protein [Acidobacteriota bacterium]